MVMKITMGFFNHEIMENDFIIKKFQLRYWAININSMKGFHMREINLMEVGGFKIGQQEDDKNMTGCTVMIFDKGCPAGVDVRGGGPASRETPLLNPVADCSALNAILLSGGSAFALDAAGGVMKYLEERDIGFDVGVTKVPLVCQSSLFDLKFGNHEVRPDADMAYKACENASYEPIKEGNYGAGCGCTVGKYHGPQAMMKGGIGTYAMEIDGIKVGAIVAVNALGDIYDIDTNEEIAGALGEDGKLLRDELQFFEDVVSAKKLYNNNTTIGIVVTNAKLDKTSLNKVASMAHNGYGRAIRPVHTMADGDSIYAVSTGDKDADVNFVGPLAAIVMGRAIGRAVRAAESALGVKSARDLVN